MRARLSVILPLAGAAWLLFAFRTSATWGDDFMPRYGSFALSRGDLSFRLSQLAFVLPAGLLLATGLGALRPSRARDLFNRLSSTTWRWAIAFASVAFATAMFFRFAVLEGAEVTDDENAYALQAWLVQHGALFAPSPPEALRPFFDNQFVVNDGRWYASYFVGHPAVLALARRLGVEGALGPAFAAAIVVLTWDVGRRVSGRRVAWAAAGLVAFSPFVAALFATRLSQPTNAFFLALATWAVLRIEEAPRRTAWWVLAAASASAAMLVRPQTALMFLAAVLGPTAWRVAWRRLDAGWRAPLAGALTLGAGALVFLGVNLAQNGAVLRTGYQAYWAQGPHPEFPWSVASATRSISDGLVHLDFWLFGWPLSFLFLPFFIRRGFLVRLAGACLLVAAFYATSAVPTVAPVGPVYFGELVPALALLSASGWERVVEWCSRQGWPRIVDVAVLSPATMTLLAALTFFPTQAWWLWRSSRVTSVPYRVAADAHLDHALVFVDVMPSRVLAPHSWAYFRRNPAPDLSDPIVWVRDLGEERNRELIRATGRRGYRLVPPGETVRLIPIPP